MTKRRFSVGVTGCLLAVLSAIAVPSSPVSAVAPSLTVTEPTGNIHYNGSALWGGDTSPVMSTPEAERVSIKPYAYGPYSVIWNFSNPDSKRVSKIEVETFRCNSPTQCSTVHSRESKVLKNLKSDTFVHIIGSDDLHKNWIRSRMIVSFSDGTGSVISWTKSRYYISDAPRNEPPVASVRGNDNTSVPQNTAMTMTFNKWTGLTKWGLASFRVTRIYQCSMRPTDGVSTFVSSVAPGNNCTLLTSNNAFEAHNDQSKVLNFTTGPKGTYIYALDTLVYNNFANAGQYVDLQKRAIYYTYDPNELPTGPSLGGGAGTDPGAVSPLQAAGINTTTAPVLSTTGQVTANGITVVIESNRRYRRGTQRRVIKVSAIPNDKSQGALVAALISTSGGIDTVHLTKTKNVRNGKARWRWRFPTSLPRGQYTLYVSLTPANTAIAPMTITKPIRLR